MSLMPLIRFLVFKRTAYYFKLVAIILLLNKIIPTYSYYAERGLIYIIIIALSSHQPFFYTKYIIFPYFNFIYILSYLHNSAYPLSYSFTNFIKSTTF